MKRIVIISLWFLTSMAFSQPMITKVIELNYLSADKVIQLIQPLLQSGEQLSGSGQTLIVKVSPHTLTQVREVLHQIDLPPVTFNIAVYQGDANWLSAQNSNSTVYSTHSPSEEQRSQSIKVMSGQSAVVNTDQQVPIISAVSGGFYPGVAYQQHQVNNGLLVQPVLRGSQVQLTIKKVREQIDPAGGQQFDNQKLATTLLIPLNKWVSLGSSEGMKNSDSSATTNSAGRPFTQNATLYIKVSIINSLPAGESK